MTAAASPPLATERALHLRRALQLEFLTVGWHVLEGIIAVLAALAARSVALLGFGLDSFVESASGAVLARRLQAERSKGYASEETEALGQRAHRLVGCTLFCSRPTWRSMP